MVLFPQTKLIEGVEGGRQLVQGSLGLLDQIGEKRGDQLRYREKRKKRGEERKEAERIEEERSIQRRRK